MQPTSAQILRAIKANIEELMLPQLQGPHARSSGRNALMLLDHVIARLEGEGAALSADNAEKRDVLARLGEEASRGAPGDRLGSVATDLDERLAAIPRAGRYVSVDDLTEEAESLRALTDEWILALHANREELGEERFETLRGPLRAQLRSQLDRDARFVASVELARIFGNEDA